MISAQRGLVASASGGGTATAPHAASARVLPIASEIPSARRSAHAGGWAGGVCIMNTTLTLCLDRECLDGS